MSEDVKRYPDGWPVHDGDDLAAALYEPERRNHDLIEKDFGSLAEWARDDYRAQAAAAREFFAPEKAELDALRKKVTEYAKAFDTAQKHRKSIGTEGSEVWFAQRDEFDRLAEDALSALREAAHT